MGATVYRVTFAKDQMDAKAWHDLSRLEIEARSGNPVLALQKYDDLIPGLNVQRVDGLYEGLVLSIEARSEQVMSDDWEMRNYVTIFHPGTETEPDSYREYSESGYIRYDSATRKNVYLSGLDQDNGFLPDVGRRVIAIWKVDATPEIRERYEVVRRAYMREATIRRNAKNFREKLEEFIRDWSQISEKTGVPVQVVKGRKAPFGSGYHVRQTGRSQYGNLYAHITAADGTEYNFINQDNLVAEPDWLDLFCNRNGGFHWNKEVNILLAQVATETHYRHGPTDEGSAWHILYDMLGDLEPLANWDHDEISQTLEAWEKARAELASVGIDVNEPRHYAADWAGEAFAKHLRELTGGALITATA